MANCNLCNVYLPDGEEHATLRKTFPDNSETYNPICPSCVAKHIASYRRQADYFIFFWCASFSFSCLWLMSDYIILR
jgi:hypothetical protein